MKAISGSIVMLSGAVLIAAGVTSVRGEGSFAVAVGGILLIGGISAWIAGLRTEK